MQIIVQPIGTEPDFRLLGEACLTLNILQTLWQFKVQNTIPRPSQKDLGRERFEQILALQTIPSLEEFNEGPEGLVVGAFAGTCRSKEWAFGLLP